VELTAENRTTAYIPEGFAHGFQTLEDNTEVFYQMSEFYHPECPRRVRWDDPAFGIVWPEVNPIMSSGDKSYSNYELVGEE
jgi:dTDP-4-dehydrorhamnose 3,5-epimerase